jgi:hypothetical protein
MKGSALAVVIVGIAIIAVIGMASFIFLDSSKNIQSQSSSASNSPSSGVPQATVKDFAPNLPMSQKSTILIELSDSSMVKYVVPKDQVSTYVKSLPPGYHVVSTSP